MDRLAVVRGMHHPMTNHNSAAFATLCGRVPLKGDLEILGNDRNDPPCLGSILSERLPSRPGLPTFVAVPHVMHNVVVLPGQVAGFLGSAHNPLHLTRDPNAPDFRLGELELPGDVSVDRLGHRESLLHLVDAQYRRADQASASAALDVYDRKAFELLRSPAVRQGLRARRGGPEAP